MTNYDATNNIDEMNVIKMKSSIGYDIVGTLQFYYAAVQSEQHFGVHKQRWNLDGGTMGTMTRSYNEKLNLAEKVRLILDYYSLSQYLGGGNGTGCLSLDFFQSAGVLLVESVGHTTRSSWTELLLAFILEALSMKLN